MSEQSGVCRVPDCGRVLGVVPWEHDGLCFVHTGALFRFIDEISARAKELGVSPGEILAHQWLGEWQRRTEEARG